ncbi:MAG TPA: transcription termination/antitermination NusG family protein [Candidatus Didemnitutus sp.]|nr:transcription termination/antitermination NusG family protein [Candidatus Didemnitutus sp.]
MGQHLPEFHGRRWFVAHTKPRAEKKFASLLSLEKFPHYLALIESVRQYGGRRRVFSKPLFPGYVFVQIEGSQRQRLYQQDLLVRALPVENEAAFLTQLEMVKAICASGLEAAIHPLIRKGTRVRVHDGPLHGVEGYVDDPVNPRGIVVSVDVLQQGLLVRLPLSSLQPLP